MVLDPGGAVHACALELGRKLRGVHRLPRPVHRARQPAPAAAGARARARARRHRRRRPSPARTPGVPGSQVCGFSCAILAAACDFASSINWAICVSTVPSPRSPVSAMSVKRAAGLTSASCFASRICRASSVDGARAGQPPGGAPRRSLAPALRHRRQVLRGRGELVRLRRLNRRLVDVLRVVAELRGVAAEVDEGPAQRRLEPGLARRRASSAPGSPPPAAPSRRRAARCSRGCSNAPATFLSHRRRRRRLRGSGGWVE